MEYGVDGREGGRRIGEWGGTGRGDLADAD